MARLISHVHVAFTHNRSSLAPPGTRNDQIAKSFVL